MNLGLADSILRGLVDESVLFVTLGPKRIMDEVLTWREAPETLSLATGEVHVWRLALDQPESVLTEFRRALDSDEIERTGRFHFEKHRRHFVRSEERRVGKECRS